LLTLRRVNVLLAGAAFAGLLSLAAYYRFANITHVGMSTAKDNWKYLDIAKQWADGNSVWMGGKSPEPDDDDRYYRPGIHLLHGLAVRWLGFNDYSIKIVNAVLDLGTIILIFLVASRLARNLWVGVFTVPLYALQKRVLATQVLYEAPHGPSTFFVLLSLLVYLNGQRAAPASRARALAMAGAGLSVGVAANMHADLALLGPGYIASILLAALGRKRRGAARQFLAEAAVLTAGFWLPYILGVTWFGPSEVFRVFWREFHYLSRSYAPHAQSSGLLMRILDVFRHGIASQYYRGAFGQYAPPIMLYVFAGAVFLAMVRFPHRGKTHPEAYTPLAVLLAYAALYAGIIGVFKPELGRVFLPLLPLFLITITYWYYDGLKAWAGRLAVPALGVLCLALVWHSPRVNAPFPSNSSRLAYDALVGRVGNDDRLLLLPLTHLYAQFPKEHRRWGLPHPIYLGDNAFYLTHVEDFPFPYTADSLETIVLRENVRYVFVYESWLQKETVLEAFPRFRVIGEQRQPYSYEQEQAIIGEFLERSFAKRIGRFEGGLFEVGRPAPWRTWNFTGLCSSDAAWRVHTGPSSQSEEGLVCHVNPLGEQWLLLRGLACAAPEILGIRMKCYWKNPVEGVQGFPSSVTLFWRCQDDASDARWLFPEKCHKNLVPVRPDDVSYQARLEGHPEWHGIIEDLGIQVKVPRECGETDTVKEVNLAIESIELVRDQDKPEGLGGPPTGRDRPLSASGQKAMLATQVDAPCVSNSDQSASVGTDEDSRPTFGNDRVYTR